MYALYIGLYYLLNPRAPADSYATCLVVVKIWPITDTQINL
jgi:hypothetical protein